MNMTTTFSSQALERVPNHDLFQTFCYFTLCIQEAHIGLGIIGHEGTAAAQASDFAFTKFKYLRRALLVHGHWYYIRFD